MAGPAALGLVVGFSTGDSTGGLLATGAGGEEAGALGEDTGAAGEEAGADGALAGLYRVTEQPDFATSSAGQVTISQSTLTVSVNVLEEQGGFDVRRIVGTLHPIPAETAARLQRSWE